MRQERSRPPSHLAPPSKQGVCLLRQPSVFTSMSSPPLRPLSAAALSLRTSSSRLPCLRLTTYHQSTLAGMSALVRLSSGVKAGMSLYKTHRHKESGRKAWGRSNSQADLALSTGKKGPCAFRRSSSPGQLACGLPFSDGLPAESTHMTWAGSFLERRMSSTAMLPSAAESPPAPVARGLAALLIATSEFSSAT